MRGKTWFWWLLAGGALWGLSNRRKAIAAAYYSKPKSSIPSYGTQPAPLPASGDIYQVLEQPSGIVLFVGPYTQALDEQKLIQGSKLVKL